MSQQGGQKRKRIRKALAIKREADKLRNIVVIMAVVAVALVAFYSINVTLGRISDMPEASMIMIVIAVIIGMMSMRWTKQRREYLDFLAANNLTKEDIADQVAGDSKA